MQIIERKLLLSAIFILKFTLGTCCLNVIAASELEKKIYECCNEKLKSGNVAKLMRSISENDSQCVSWLKNDVEKSGPYYDKCKAINLNEFSYWCKKLKETPNGDTGDAFLLSLSSEFVPLDNKMKHILFDVIYGGKYKHLYRPVRISDLSIIQRKNFWKNLFNKITDDEHTILICISYMKQCFDYFDVYFEGKEYLFCSGTIVKNFLDPIMRYYSKDKKTVIQKLSPKVMNERDGFLTLMCSPRGPIYHLSSGTTIGWELNRIESFIYNSAKFIWPFEMIKYVLQSNVKKITKYIPSDNPYVESKEAWNFAMILNLIDFACIKVIVNEAEDIYTHVFTTNNPLSCINDIYELSILSDDYFQLSSKSIQELLRYKYLDKFSSKLGITRKENPKDTRHILTVMNQLKEGTYITAEMVKADLQKVGLRALITFVVLFNKIQNKIKDADVNLILKKIKEIPLTVAFDAKEKQINNIKKEPLVIDNKSSGKDIRQNYGYEPDYSYNSNSKENYKTWGKVVFVAVHVICIRYNEGAIQPKEIAAQLNNCIDDIKSQTKKDLYCQMFKTNPYFGEFDKLIENDYRLI